MFFLLGIVLEVSPFRPRGPPGAGVGTTLRYFTFYITFYITFYVAIYVTFYAPLILPYLYHLFHYISMLLLNIRFPVVFHLSVLLFYSSPASLSFLSLMLSLIIFLFHVFSFSSDASSDFTSFLPSVSVGGPSPFVALELGGLMPSEDSKNNW